MDDNEECEFLVELLDVCEVSGFDLLLEVGGHEVSLREYLHREIQDLVTEKQGPILTLVPK